MSLFYQFQMWNSVCMFIFLKYEVLFGGSNDQFMGLILVSFFVQTLIMIYRLLQLIITSTKEVSFL